MTKFYVPGIRGRADICGKQSLVGSPRSLLVEREGAETLSFPRQLALADERTSGCRRLDDGENPAGYIRYIVH